MINDNTARRWHTSYMTIPFPRHYEVATEFVVLAVDEAFFRERR